MAELQLVTSGLVFPEGPVAMPDGSVIVVEMLGECLTRVLPDGIKDTIAEIPGGPNGAALGPDGAMYIANNGGCFTTVDLGEMIVPGPFSPEKYTGGRIQKVDLDTGEVTDLYTECNGWPLRAPNDIVFDAHGGFYFTDHGYAESAKRVDHMVSIFYGKADGSDIHEVAFPAHGPNGIGISPDGKKLYWAETFTARIIQRDIIEPGQLGEVNLLAGSSACLYGFGGLRYLDSLGIDADGNVCVASIMPGGIGVISPEGEWIDFVDTGDMLTTNICFGGDDLRTAYITLSSSGRLVKMTWPRPGLALPYLNG